MLTPTSIEKAVMAVDDGDADVDSVTNQTIP
jgi:hypothetical protein